MGFFGWFARRSPSPPESPMGVSVLLVDGGTILVVRYGGYPPWDTLPITEDPWSTHRTEMLRLAFQCTAGAGLFQPKVVATSPMEFSDDIYCDYECRLPPTRPNLTALLASGLPFETEASELAHKAAISDADVEATRARMRAHAVAHVAEINRVIARSAQGASSNTGVSS